MKNLKTQGIPALVVLAILASFIMPSAYSVTKAEENQTNKGITRDKFVEEEVSKVFNEK